MPRYPEYQIHSLDTYGYGRIIQTIDGKFYDGWGNTVTFTLFGKEVTINVEGSGSDSTDGGNIGGTTGGGTTGGNSTGGDLFQELQNQIDALTKSINVQQTTINNTVPTGTIIMWGGSEAGIPDGWTLCDGKELTVDSKLKTQLMNQSYPFGGASNGKPIIPDLRERFVVGAGKGNNIEVSGGSYDVGSFGGFNQIQTSMRDKTPVELTTNSINCVFLSVTINGQAANLTISGSNTNKTNDGIWEIGATGFATGTSTMSISYECDVDCIVYIEIYYNSTYISTRLGLKVGTNTNIYSKDGPTNDFVSVKIKTSIPTNIKNIKIKATNPGINGSTRTRIYSVSDITTTASSPSQENYIVDVENRPPYFALCYIIKL